MKKIIKHWQGFLTLYIVFSLFFAIGAHAANWTDPGLEDYGKNLYQDNQSKSPSAGSLSNFNVNSIMQSLIRSTTCANCDKRDLEAKKSSGMSVLAQGVGTIYAMPPASGFEYVNYIASKAGFVEPAYAAGAGYDSLSPVRTLWTAFRNIAYLGFVLYFVIIGFMIMFRAKLDPKTTVTIQNSLPRVIVTLILVTFSYAIAGLMIDLMYIAIYLVMGVFSSSGLITNMNSFKDEVFKFNVFTAVWAGGVYFWNSPAQAIGQVLGNLFGVGSGVTGWGAGFGGFTDLVGNLVTGIISVVLSFIFSITAIIVMLILFMTLLKTYISIIASIILSPLVLSLNAIPGNDTVGNWFKNLIAELSAFPVIICMFLLAATLSGPPTGIVAGNTNPWGVQGNGMTGANAFVPPLIGMTNPTNNSMPLGALIGFTIFLMTPSAINMVKELIKAGGMKSAKGVGMMVGVSGAMQAGSGLMHLGYETSMVTRDSKGLWDKIRGKK